MHGRFLRGAALVTLLLILLFFSASAVQSHLNRGTEAFVGQFIASVRADPDGSDRYLAPGSDARAGARELRRWMTSEHRLLRCKPLLLPFSRYYECVAQLSNGAFVYLDVDAQQGQKLVTILRVAPPPTGR